MMKANTIYLELFEKARKRKPDTNSKEYLDFCLMLRDVRRKEIGALVECIVSKTVMAKDVYIAWCEIHKSPPYGTLARMIDAKKYAAYNRHGSVKSNTAK